MKTLWLRILLLCVSSGVLWYLCFMSFFVWSGAQSILANPAHQSPKFLAAFMETEPLPRMIGDEFFMMKGAYCISLLWVALFLFLNAKLGGNWLRKGVVFGTIIWAAMVPWFEFYLPYNVMNEPLDLLLFEATLWLGSILSLGLLYSFILNFRRQSYYTAL